MLRKGASHEGNNTRQTRLMYSQAIEKPFHNHCRLAVKHGPMQIEENQRFAEPGRKAVSRFGCAKRSACIGHESAILAVNGYHNASLHVPLPLKEANPNYIPDYNEFLERDTDLIVGSRFWNFIGDEQTYRKLLEIAEEVGTSTAALIPAAVTSVHNGALDEFRIHYHDPNIAKWDTSHYVYAVLPPQFAQNRREPGTPVHHPDYRHRYAANLKRELPRIPFVSAPNPVPLSGTEDESPALQPWVGDNDGPRVPSGTAQTAGPSKRAE